MEAPSFEPSVFVETVDRFDNVLYMLWDVLPTRQDVNSAFAQLNAFLDKSREPIYVIVDIRSNPRFPLGLTLTKALHATNHPTLHSWLVLGTNRTARFIANNITIGKHNIHWFENEEDVFAHLEQSAKA